MPIIINGVENILLLFAEERCTTSSAIVKTISKRECIFPFKYKGTNYHECTRIQSDKPWCAYEVDAFGNATIGKWGDCDLGCTNLGKNLICMIQQSSNILIILTQSKGLKNINMHWFITYILIDF